MRMQVAAVVHSHPCGRNGFNVIELVIAIGVAGLLGTMALPRILPTMSLMRYRSAMQQVAAELRIMRFRAINEQRPFIMRIDSGSGRIQLFAIDKTSTQREWIERTIWLPDGLDIIEAPEELLVSPSGDIAQGALLSRVADFHRVFRLTVTAGGIVRLNEEPSI